MCWSNKSVETLETETKIEHSSAFVFLAELLDFFEIVLKEFDGLLDVTVVHHARVTAKLFGQDLFGHILVQLVESVVELDVILGEKSMSSQFWLLILSISTILSFFV